MSDQAGTLTSEAASPLFLDVHEHTVGGEVVWIALRARGADYSWLTRRECVRIAREWLEKYDTHAEDRNVGD